jgi:hypothetical protein
LTCPYSERLSQLFAKGLEQTAFDDLTLRLFLNHLTAAVTAPAGYELLLIDLPMALPTLAAWISQDNKLATAVAGDQLYASRDEAFIDVSGPAYQYKVYGRRARRQSQAITTSWLFGFESPLSTDFIGNVTGIVISPETAKQERSNLAARFPVVHRFTNAFRQDYVRPLRDSDLDESFRAKFGRRQENWRGFARFDEKDFTAATRNRLLGLRAVAMSTVTDAIAEKLNAKSRIVAVLRDSVVVEAPAGTSQTGVGPECVAAAQAALSKTFNGLQPVLGFGVGLTWGDAAIALDAQLVARNQPEPVPAEPADLYPHLTL